jgi:hypothetical protein
MHIIVVGGRERNEVELSRVAREHGHTIECHDGGVAGRGVESIRNSVARASIVVIVTEVNSHGAVQAAKKEAQRLRKPTMVVSRLSLARLRGLLEAWRNREERATGGGVTVLGYADSRLAIA